MIDTYLILDFPWFHRVQKVQPLFQASVQLWLVELKKESDNFSYVKGQYTIGYQSGFGYPILASGEVSLR